MLEFWYDYLQPNMVKTYDIYKDIAEDVEKKKKIDTDIDIYLI